MVKNQNATPSFVVEFPLRLSPAQEATLHSRLEAARQVYNACLGESLERLKRLRGSAAYQAACATPRDQMAERQQAFAKANQAAGFREFDLHAYAKQFGHSWLGEHLDSLTVQTLATRAFKATQDYAFGQKGKPRFKSYGQVDSVEGKNNDSGLRWRGDHLEWSGLALMAIIDVYDPVSWHGLTSPVKYARVVRRKLNGRACFYVQLVCQGIPYQKEKNRIGKGKVGLDLGPSTVAYVSQTMAALKLFCAELDDQQAEIRCLQRQADRQRRANNPCNYNADGTIKAGKKEWRKSNRQQQTETKLAEAQRRQAAYRGDLHGRLVNELFRLGDEIQLEKVSYKGWQRQYGKSAGKRAPGNFVEMLRRKAASAGVRLNEFPTRTTKLSQTCHHCGKVEPKPLSQRWHECECGVVAQRDLYSAFLAMCVENERLNADFADEAWSGVDRLLRAALSEVKPAKDGHLPGGFGLSLSQSRSPAQTGTNERYRRPPRGTATLPAPGWDVNETFGDERR